MSKKKVQKQSNEAPTEATKGLSKSRLSIDQKYIIVYLLILLFAFIPTYNHIFDKKVANIGDNAAYYVFGRAIAQGHGYVNAHVVQKSPVNAYPPGYPAFISVVMKGFGEEIETIKKTNGVLFFLSLIILFFFFRQITMNIHFSFVLSLVMLFNYYLLQYSTWMMSEIPFIFFSSLSLLGLAQLNEKRNPLKDIWFWVFLIGMVASYHIRSQGVALFGGAILYFLVQKNWKYLATTFGGFVALVIPWMIRNSKLGSSPYESALKYKDYYNRGTGEMEGISDWIDRFTANFSRYMTSEIPSAIFGTEPKYDEGSWMAGILILAFVGIGIFKLKKLQIAIAGYILATFAILMIWPPVWTGVRFMLPVVPLLIFLFFYGIYQLIVLVLTKAKAPEKALSQYLPYAFLLMAFIYTPKLELLNKQAKRPVDKLFYTYFELAKWTKTNLPDDAIILCRKPMLFHLYSNHSVDGIVKLDDPDAALNKMRERKFTHIVYYGDGLSQRYFVPLLKKYQNKFPIIQKVGNPPIYLMEIKPDAN